MNSAWPAKREGDKIEKIEEIIDRCCGKKLKPGTTILIDASNSVIELRYNKDTGFAMVDFEDCRAIYDPRRLEHTPLEYIRYQAEVHKRFFDKLREETSMSIDELNEWYKLAKRKQETVEQQISLASAAINLFMEAGNIYYTWKETGRPMTIRGFLEMLIGVSEEGQRDYQLVARVFRYGKDMIEGGIARLDGQLGETGKSEGAELVRLAGELAFRYERLSLNEGRIADEMKEIRGIMYPEKPYTPKSL